MPEIKENPHPKARYEVTLTIDDAPGPFDTVSGFVQYEVTNTECVPDSDPINRIKKPPRHFPPITFERVNDHQYRGAFYADLMQDEDYYGMGVCHWHVTGAVATLKNHNVTFAPGLFADDIAEQKPATRYYAEGDYRDSDDARTVSGNPNRAYYKPESRTDIFSITLVAKDVSP
ncbi:hypothetical protein [Dyella sp.]|uniref:hypothetical protein n=1 Tax=Dyella sp. TaxID=1869338 RepID=UPI002ED01224